ncbi:hypothetical protein [Nocardia amamiensis]|uniref:hypothetical protein n=1 Tax=Nocardia amamiensis TaxID=404578 RepID=UPI000A688BA0|nr:hypothetical protein [Nocardia amamiensis]
MASQGRRRRAHWCNDHPRAPARRTLAAAIPESPIFVGVDTDTHHVAVTDEHGANLADREFPTIERARSDVDEQFGIS